MSPLDSMRASLETMGFAQLGCAFVAMLAYASALNASLSATARLWAAGTALIAATVFATLTPSWVSGVALMGLIIVATAAFVAGAWLLAALCGLQTGAEVTAVVDDPVASAAEPSYEADPAGGIGGPLSLPAPSTPS